MSFIAAEYERRLNEQARIEYLAVNGLVQTAVETGVYWNQGTALDNSTAIITAFSMNLPGSTATQQRATVAPVGMVESMLPIGEPRRFCILTTRDGQSVTHTGVLYDTVHDIFQFELLAMHSSKTGNVSFDKFLMWINSGREQGKLIDSKTLRDRINFATPIPARMYYAINSCLAENALPDDIFKLWLGDGISNLDRFCHPQLHRSLFQQKG